VHIHVCFGCDENEPVAALGKEFIERIEWHRHSDTGGIHDGAREARWFLEALAERTGGNPGPKGGLSLWGMVGNYTKADVFVDILLPFWEALFERQPGGFLDHEHILVFEEAEQTERTIAFEIMREAGAVVVKRHDCPFAFMQF
jgi:hypothetical protein